MSILQSHDFSIENRHLYIEHTVCMRTLWSSSMMDRGNVNIEMDQFTENNIHVISGCCFISSFLEQYWQKYYLYEWPIYRHESDGAMIKQTKHIKICICHASASSEHNMHFTILFINTLLLNTADILDFKKQTLMLTLRNVWNLKFDTVYFSDNAPYKIYAFPKPYPFPNFNDGNG